MRRRVKRAGDNADIDMTPMLDIVFILLIFFIVTAVFLQEQGIDMRPPPPSDNENSEPNPVILVQITPESRVFVNQEPTSILRVSAAVSRIRAEQPDSAVLLEVQDEADHGDVVLLWDEMKANSIPVSITRAQSDES